MNQEIELVKAATYNHRFVKRSRVEGAFEIKVASDKAQLVFPASTPDELFKMYKKGGTVYIVGDEIISHALIGIDNPSKKFGFNYYDSQGIQPITIKEFTGSIMNGGYWVIAEVDEDNKTLTFETDGVEEDFSGTVLLSAWNKNIHQSSLAAYIQSANGQTGIISEKVKNYSYQMDASKNKVDIATGIPKDIMFAFNQYKKLPATLNVQLKSCIMSFIKGGLINRLSIDTLIYKESVTHDDIGQAKKSYTNTKTIKMYITSTGGSRDEIATKEDLTQRYVGQTTVLDAGIAINDLLKQDNQVYRVTDIDENAANVMIEAEYKLIRVDNIQDKLVA